MDEIREKSNSNIGLDLLENPSKKRNNDNIYSGITDDIIDNTTNNLRLKRTKPLPNYKNTLESCMNLKYV